MKFNRNIAGMSLSLLAMAAAGGCSSLPGSTPPTPDHAMPGDKRPTLNFLNKEKIQAVNAKTPPSRELDVEDPNQGRLTLIERYRKKLDRISNLEAELRAKSQLNAALETSNQEFSNELTRTKAQLREAQQARDDMEKNLKALRTEFLKQAMKLAQVEKELLTRKINELTGGAGMASERRTTAPPSKAPASKPAEKPAEKSKGEKK